MLVADRASGQWVETLEMHGHNKSVLVNCPDTITITDGQQSHTTSMTPLAYGWAMPILFPAWVCRQKTFPPRNCLTFWISRWICIRICSPPILKLTPYL